MSAGRRSVRARGPGRRGHGRETTMLRIAAASLGLIVVGLPPFELNGAQAQDIAGMEDCTKTAGLDKRTGCFQSNVNFLHQLVTKNALDARQRLNAANNEIAALKNEIIATKRTMARLTDTVWT